MVLNGEVSRPSPAPALASTNQNHAAHGIVTMPLLRPKPFYGVAKCVSAFEPGGGL